MLTLEKISSIGLELYQFVRPFGDCFARSAGRQLLKIYVSGQLASNIKRKNCEAIALAFKQCPRNLQRFLESIKWDEERLRDRCQQIVASDHAHPEAIGTIDESGTHKSGHHTVGVARQYNGNRGKVENCTVGVHLGYNAPGFQCLLDSRMYLPESWANDPERREKNHVPDEIEFQTKPEIAIDLVRRALSNGIRVKAWTFDELYGRDTGFLDSMEGLDQAFVAEIPGDFHGWVRKPVILRPPLKPTSTGRPVRKPRPRKSDRSCRVDNLARYSRVFRKQKWQRYRIKDTDHGPEVWEVKHAVFWRKQQSTKLPTNRHTLLVCRNVRTGEVKYFLSNQVIGENGVTLRGLLRVAFGRWAIEHCFRTAKEELGMDHFEVRGWRCVHRHWYVTGLSYLFCSRLRQKWDDLEPADPLRKLTVEQVRAAVNCWLAHHDLPPPLRNERYQDELDRHHYHQRRNAQAIKSHTKTRYHELKQLGIDPDKIKSCQQIE